MKELAEIVIQMYAPYYDEVERNQDFIMQNLENEEKKFRNTLGKALRKFERILSDTGTITGKDAFLLFTSFGLPHEMTRELAEEKGIEIDMDEFEREFLEFPIGYSGYVIVQLGPVAHFTYNVIEHGDKCQEGQQHGCNIYCKLHTFGGAVGNGVEHVVSYFVARYFYFLIDCFGWGHQHF